jgi:4-azaleucine resistance transporter AzlC
MKKPLRRINSYGEALVLRRALQFSFPVFLGYITSGIAFGLVLSDTGYPWYIALLTSVVMYAGAGQFTACTLFATGAGIFQAVIIQLVLNARHFAYGLTLLKQINTSGKYKPYLIFSLTDETFALHTTSPTDIDPLDKPKFMFYISLFDQLYWIAGAVIGALLGELIPFPLTNIDFAMTALFIVLTIEQYYKVRHLYPFVITMFITILSVIILPSRITLIAAIVVSLCSVQAASGRAAVK